MFERNTQCLTTCEWQWGVLCQTRLMNELQWRNTQRELALHHVPLQNRENDRKNVLLKTFSKTATKDFKFATVHRIENAAQATAPRLTTFTAARPQTAAHDPHTHH